LELPEARDVDDHFQQVAHGIHGDMPVAPVVLFSGIIAALTASFGRLNALCADRARTEICFTIPLTPVKFP
jgi:hypothetical protein